jgi:benzoyl-CoA reductase/2-hydroxyglutaryl-CoA dehydratase subunit BcrC/BadD/HgdB
MLDHLDIPNRNEAIAEHKGQGGRIAAVFPIHYPREILRAFDVLPVEVWGPPSVDATAAGAHIQAYTCAVVRKGLSFLLQGGLDMVDLIVVPNDCDSLQGLGSVLLDFVKPTIPVVTFYPPRARRPSDLAYLIFELRAMGERIGKILGKKPSDDELRRAIAREEAADAALTRLHRERARLGLPDGSLYRLIRSREFLPAERFTELAQRALEAGGEATTQGIPLLLSGIVPEPWELFDALEEMGAKVVADDLACCGRRLYPPGTADEPWRRAAQRLMGAAPSPMCGSSIDARLDHLRWLAESSGAAGVVFYEIKFCEPEQFDLPELRRGLQAIGLPSVVLEVDLGGDLPSQAVTRLEAFVEMIR